MACAGYQVHHAPDSTKLQGVIVVWLQVKVVDTGAAVLAAMRTAVFDIILLDIHMPEVRVATHVYPPSYTTGRQSWSKR